MSADRVFSVEEVNAALQLAGSADRFNRLEAGLSPVYWWELGERHRIAALALGVLPVGWERSGVEGVLYEIPNAARGPLDRYCDAAVSDDGDVWFEDWPEAVRSGQAEIACRLLAAHVELERLRAGGVK